MDYIPSQGDIVMMDFKPQSGYEQSGRRPALVVSNNSYQRYTNLCIVCPITTQSSKFPLHIDLETSSRTKGTIMCEQVKALDLKSRNAIYIDRVHKNVLGKVLNIVSLFFDMNENQEKHKTID